MKGNHILDATKYTLRHHEYILCHHGLPLRHHVYTLRHIEFTLRQQCYLLRIRVNVDLPFSEFQFSDFCAQIEQIFVCLCK